MNIKRHIRLMFVLCSILLWSGYALAQEPSAKKPNILIIWGDDIGQFNVSFYDSKRSGPTLSSEVPMFLQERAYTSPIWYTPE